MLLQMYIKNLYTFIIKHIVLSTKLHTFYKT